MEFGLHEALTVLVPDKVLRLRLHRRSLFNIAIFRFQTQPRLEYPKKQNNSRSFANTINMCKRDRLPQRKQPLAANS